jgi:hypothetical protein
MLLTSLLQMTKHGTYHVGLWTRKCRQSIVAINSNGWLRQQSQR